MNVIDSSIALHWVLPDPRSAEAEVYYGRNDSAAPDVILVEVANVLAKKVRASDLSGEAALQALDFVRDGLGTLVPGAALAPRELELSIVLSHPVYDCIFLACAERLKATVVTHDAPFVRRATERGFAHLIEGAER